MQYLSNKFKYYTFNGMVMCKQHITHEGLNKKSNSIYKYPEDCVLEQKVLIVESDWRGPLHSMTVNISVIAPLFYGEGSYGGSIGVAIGPDIDSLDHSPTTLTSLFNRIGRNDIEIDDGSMQWATLADIGPLGTSDSIPNHKYFGRDFLEAEIFLSDIKADINKDIFRFYIYYNQHMLNGLDHGSPAIMINVKPRIYQSGWGGASFIDTVNNQFVIASYGNTVDISNFEAGYKFEDMMTTSISGMITTDYNTDEEFPNNVVQSKLCCIGAIEYDIAEDKLWWIENHNKFNIIKEFTVS